MKSSNCGTYPMIISQDNWCTKELFDKSKVKKITISNGCQIGQILNCKKSWDISEENDDSITAYLINGESEIIISGNGSKYIKTSSSVQKMFAGFSSLECILGLELLDVELVTDMSYLFYHCTSLKELDLSSWNVSRVQNFRGTFCCGQNQVGNAEMRKLNISNWDVSSAIDMAYMFYGCGNLKELDVSRWNVSNVKNFRHTFADCFKLKQLDVSKWDTRSVITLDGIFNDCRSIKKIDVSNWNTSSCQEFDQLFDGCSSLKKINGIEKIDTSSGFSFEEMFFGCQNLKQLDLSSIDTRGVDGHEFTAYNSSIKSYSNMKKILAGCRKLKKVIFGENFKFKCVHSSDNTILKAIDEEGFAIVTPQSNSMWPLIRKKKDQAVFKRRNCYNKNDIVLFQSDFSDSLVMHRIIRVLSQGYIICGDRSRYCEYVPKESVYAYASSINRKGKDISRNSCHYAILSLLSLSYDSIYNKYEKDGGIVGIIVRKTKSIIH